MRCVCDRFSILDKKENERELSLKGGTITKSANPKPNQNIDQRVCVQEFRMEMYSNTKMSWT